MSTQYETEVGLGQAIFGQAPLGDKRRTARLVETFDRMCKHPGGTLPHKLAEPADLRAFYRLCNCDQVTHQTLIAQARQHTLARIAEHEGDVLLVHDATELDYTSLKSLTESLGQIGNGNGRGYVCQNVLAVSAETGAVLGLMDQILHHRIKTPQGETLAEKRERKSRESLLWIHGTKNLPKCMKLVDVADQGADTFEFLEHEYYSGRRFVIRVSKQRKVSAGHTPGQPLQNLKDFVASQPALGRFTMDVQAQKGREGRKQAEFEVRGAALLIHPPHAKCGHHGDEPLPMYVVQVVEVSPPPQGEEPIEWTLLTKEPAETYESAWRVAGWYERRWVVEEYHKAKKTGCGIEQLQFTTLARLEPAIALLSIVALTLLNLQQFPLSSLVFAMEGDAGS